MSCPSNCQTAACVGLTQLYLGGPQEMGDAVALRVIEWLDAADVKDTDKGKARDHNDEGSAVDVVVITKRSNTTSPECFEKLGIDVNSKHILVPKTLNNCRPGFDRVASQFIRIDYAGGCCMGDVRAIPFEHLAPSLPMWPLHPDPLGLELESQQLPQPPARAAGAGAAAGGAAAAVAAQKKPRLDPTLSYR